MNSIIFYALFIGLLIADHTIDNVLADTANGVAILVNPESNLVSPTPVSSETIGEKMTPSTSTNQPSTSAISSSASFGSTASFLSGTTAVPSNGGSNGVKSDDATFRGNNEKSVPSTNNNAPAPPTPDPAIGREIVNGLISSLVPGAAAGGAAGANALGGLLPAISKLSTPIARLIVSNGKASVEDIDQLLKAVPDVAALLGLAGALGANGGIAGLAGAKSGAPATTTNFTNWTPQQIDDLISGKTPLPALNALPREYIQTVLNGGSLPGMTIDQTQALKRLYIQKAISDGVSSINGPSAPGGASAPLIGNVYANISSSQSITLSRSSSNDNIFQELKNFDLSQLPPEVVQSFLAGTTPDLSKIPQDFLDSLINKSPQLFAKIVGSALQKKINNESFGVDNQSILKNGSMSISISDQSAINSGVKSITPYDINSLDRKADISTYRKDNDNRAMLWTGIILGIVGLLVIILIAFLCWRRQRNRRLNADDMRHRFGVENGLAPNSIRIDPKSHIHTAVIDETREVRENRLNEAAAGGYYADDQRSAYTQQWILSGHRRRGNDSDITEM